MATNVRDSDTSLWLHNKLGTSNDSWISGSICSQLSKEVLRNIKDCFHDLQTQVKLKLLLSFFHIPRRLVEEWKTELEEVLEVAGIDSELWVSMVAETMKTFPATGSLNTEISDYEETRPIFTDMVNDLKKLVSKHCDLGMLPLECQYLNKNALVSVVGQQQNPVKHFTLKRKPKSANLRAELLQKSADAQSSLKKSSAPTIPLRSRGMPRKMTDTTPLKGIPSRVPTSGFRSPTSTQNQNRPNISRTPAGRKDGGIKLIEFTEQPLGYAAAKKRKRQQELEEQQKRALEAKQNAAVAVAPISSPSTPTSITPDYAAGLTASSVYTQPPTPAPTPIKDEPITKLSIPATPATNNVPVLSNSTAVGQSTPPSSILSASQIKEEVLTKTEPIVKIEVDEIKTESLPAVNTPITLPAINSNNNIIITSKPQTPITTNVVNSKLNTPILINSSTPVILSSSPQGQTLISQTQQTQTNAIRSIPISNMSKGSGGPVIISQTIIQPAKHIRTALTSSAQNIIVSSSPMITSHVPMGQVSTANNPTQIILTSSSATVPTLTSFVQSRPAQTIIQTAGNQSQPGQPTKILLKTAPSLPVMMSTASRTTNTVQNNPPPLITRQQPTILNIQNRPVTIQPASQAAQVQHIQAQLQQQQHTVVSNTNATQPPKYAQVVMSPGMNVKGKTIILAQKGVILRSVGGDVYQQIPLANMSGLGNLGGATIVTAGPPGLVKTSTAQNVQSQTVKHQIPALIPTSNLQQSNMSSLTPVVIASHNLQQPQQTHQTVQTILGNPTQQTIIRPVLTTNVQGGITTLPQGLTLIQRPGQQPQLVQVQTTQQPSQQQIQRTIITQPQTQMRPQQIIIQQRPQTIITTQQGQQTQIQQQSTQPQRKGLSLSNEHVIKAHEMFKNANRVSRPDKALILGFMAGQRVNPRPNPENVIIIKLGETEEKVKQDDDTYALMLVESLIRLDYNTGEWKTFQNYRRFDQSSQTQETKLTQTQNSVVI